jgi:DNA-directed RNA polymerase specialized sigma24 family protein
MSGKPDEPTSGVIDWQGRLVAQRDLRRVRARAKQVAAARERLRDAILEAHLSGESIRDIAPHAGLSPSRVQELLKEARDQGSP